MFYFIETAKRKRKNYNEIYSCALTRTQKYEGKKIDLKKKNKVDPGKYSFSDFVNGRLVKEYHDDLTKGSLDTIISMCETTLDGEDFQDESDSDTITQVYKIFYNMN